MICNRCGNDNQEGSKFCKFCGSKLEMNTEQSRKWETSFLELLRFFMHEKQNGKRIYFEEQPRSLNDQTCSYCGSDNTQIIQKNITDIKTKGYSIGNGCCGICLLGPVGLLCGLIGTGSKVKVNNETWMHCLNCGKEYISQATAMDKLSNFMNGLLGNAFIIGAIYSLFYYWGFESKIVAFVGMVVLSVLFPFGILMVNYNLISKELGYSIIDILSTDQRKNYWNAIWWSVGIIIVLTLITAPILEIFM